LCSTRAPTTTQRPSGLVVLVSNNLINLTENTAYFTDLLERGIAVKF
jgi:hypothetical protein